MKIISILALGIVLLNLNLTEKHHGVGSANGLALHSHFEISAEQGLKTGQAQTSKTSAPPASVVVREVDLEGLKKLLQRDSSGSHPLLVNFWATWCEPCREEFPDLVRIDADYRMRGLDMVSVTLDDPAEKETTVPQFLREMRAEKLPVYLLNVADPEPAINAIDPTWGGALPATFLYDARGQVIFKHFGRIKTAELRTAIEQTLPAKP